METTASVMVMIVQSGENATNRLEDQHT